MAKKLTAWKTKGMNRDVSVSAFNPEFAFENVNLRLATNEGNTMMSWVNEKGPMLLKDSEDNDLQLTGTPIGTAIINHKLVIFTTEATGSKPDHIYSLKYTNDAKTAMEVTELYNGNINLSVEHPLETIVYYEAEHIQKVYWTDGINQPRLINIVNEDQLEKWADSGEVEDFFFDFVPSYQMTDSAEVVKNNSSSGLFAPGVIQYCYTYINKYGQQSNVVWCSTLYYLAHSDRGASPEDKVTNSFTITIENADENFDYVRLYAIQRTSLNMDVFVRQVVDLPITGEDLIYTDNGTTGSTIDAYELLYVGGKEITAYTMADKDNTLFMGNLTQPNTLVDKIQDYFDSVRNSFNISFSNNDVDKRITLDHSHSIYTNTNMLNESLRKITTFKGGEEYRFGFQLQKRTGEWCEPIFIKDTLNQLYPDTNIYSDTINLVDASATINLTAIDTYLRSHGVSEGFDYSVYKRIRPVVVYPNIADRNVLCQGVLNPTVFNAMDRCDNSPFAQSSWFFRPFMASQEMPTSYEDTSDYTTVTTFSYDPDHPIQPSPLFPEEYPTIKRYVMIVQFTDASKIDTILTRGSLKVIQTRTTQYGASSKRTRKTEIYYDFGAVDISNTGSYGNNVYALFRDDPWQTRPDTPSNSQETVDWDWAEGVNILCSSVQVTQPTIESVPITTLMYTGLQHNASTRNLYYYVQQAGASSDYETMSFVINNQDTGFHIELSSMSQMSPDYNVSMYNTSGDWLRYKHYDSLYSAEEAEQDTDSTRLVEIQGSIGKNEPPVYSYTSDGSSSTATRAQGARRRGGTNALQRIGGVDLESPSNTQFYVDQSIVTFHSPDLDFDTDVQTYGTDNLKLRIIGAVPITASVSAHKMTTSSAMLETLHNMTDDSESDNPPLYQYGSGENNSTVIHENIDWFGGKRLVADFLWNDVFVEKSSNENLDANDRITTKADIYDFPVYPWHRNGPLNNDMRTAEYASSMLRTKKESTLLYSINTEYFGVHSVDEVNLDTVSCQIHLQENDYVHNVRLPRQKETSSEINYYPNIDKVLYNKDGYRILTLRDLESDNSTDSTASERMAQHASEMNINIRRVISEESDVQEKVTSPISMKYKSGTHAVLALGTDNSGNIKLLPYAMWGNVHVGQYSNPTDVSNKFEAFWGDTKMTFYHTGIDMSNLFRQNVSSIAHNFLWIGELYKEPINKFGGNEVNNNWLVGGPTLNIANGASSVTLKWTDGDTYYQRYDCLKTYAFTPEDTNQLVEILSFMCETHVNLDGRYDRNRGQIDNTNISPVNFNLLNPIYSQKDNYFTSRQVDNEGQEELVYPNQYWYSGTKIPGADVDEYTHVTLASTDYLDGDKGSINAIRRLNSQLVAFQDTGIAQILYNENTQISTTEGVPIEIANSGKVQGKRYLSDTIGCSNKWAMATTPTGIYFMDSNDKNIYLFNGQLQNVSIQKGFNTWSKQNIPSPEVMWNPSSFENFVAYYDKINQDILFTNAERSLAFSEKMGEFTSFYDYGGTPYLCNLDDTGIWVRTNGKLYKHNAGEYNDFFGVNKPFSMTLIGNPEPTTDKIFTNLEFRACVEDDGEYSENTGKFTPTLPFDSLETWDEYQHGIARLLNKDGREGMMHHMSDGTAALKRKFRLWRCDIPRDNAPVNSLVEKPMGIKRFRTRPMDRMRNPWIYLKLTKDAAASGSVLNKTEIHDLIMTYYS